MPRKAKSTTRPRALVFEDRTNMMTITAQQTGAEAYIARQRNRSSRANSIAPANTNAVGQPNFDGMTVDDDFAHDLRLFNENVSQLHESSPFRYSVKSTFHTGVHQKINKQNVWDVTLIDKFHSMCLNHHALVRNLSIIGRPLEAIAKVYSLRVDLAHSQVVRLMSSHGRSK